MKQSFKYSTILFDFDGTLTPSLPFWVQAFQFALAKFGVHLSTDDTIQNCFYRAWKDIVDEYELPSLSAFANHMHAGLQEAFEHAEPFAGVESFLTECCHRNIKLGIVTSGKRSIVEKFLETHNLAEAFQSLVTEGDFVNHKPHPEPVLLALGQLNSLADDTLFVGDSHADMLAASAAGIDKALIFPDEHHSYYDYAQLKAHAPHFVFQNYAEFKIQLSLPPITA